MHSNLDDRTLLLEQLSDWLLQSRDQTMWRNLFFAETRDDVAIGSKATTLLCADCPDSWAPEDAELFCLGVGGRFQRPCTADLLFFFDTPEVALQVALELQRGHRTHPIRVSMATACFTYAELLHGTHSMRLFFGDAVARTERLILSVVPGTLQLCAESYRALHRVLPAEVPEGVIATELLDDVVTLASITLPPLQNSHLSTFAGLGRF